MIKQGLKIFAIFLIFACINQVFASVSDSTQIKMKTKKVVRWGFVLYKNREANIMCTSECDLKTRTYHQCPQGFTAYALVAPNDNDYGGNCSLQSFQIQFRPTLEDNGYGGYQIHFFKLYATMYSPSTSCSNREVTIDYTIFCI